ncbi:MAG: ABC transporter ATP-binding protein [Phyllobacteriaceae bacterium]|nr:ABC transporter ATP-binding protein [Phyllobacteriaceae bacterium]MBA93350.1 ABC transporter ATP-binding protein [Phyllobacteriaceae bacterium]
MTTTARPLTLEDVRIALAGTCLLTVSARVEPGEVLTVMGPSGSGKSTLLAYVSGFLDPAFSASGRVLSGDIDITALAPEERHAGILFQDPLLFPHMSVEQNLLFAIPASVRGRAARRNMARAALARTGLEDFGPRHPDTLSGGQKARVALARVLLSAPRMLLLDEPFSKLDASLRGQMRDLVFATARASGLPVILVIHDAADAEAAGGAVIRVGTDA